MNVASLKSTFSSACWLTSESLSAALGRDVRLTIVETASVVLRRTPRRDGGLDARVHAFFAAAPPEVQGAVVGWIGRPGKRWSRVLRPFIRAHAPQAARVRTPRPLTPLGKTLDLRAVFADLNARHFGGVLRCGITFSQPVRTGRRRRSVQFGSYDVNLDTIRIHPVLDDPRVPLAFTHFVVYHEMLHAALGVREGPGGRCIHHGGDFRARERAFPLYAEAIRWEKENLDKILTLASGRKRRWTPGGVQQAIFDFASLL